MRSCRTLLATLLICFACSTAHATAMQEVNYWRSKNRLNPFIEVQWMTEHCQRKAEYRAARGLQHNHAGPKTPPG